MNTYGGLLSFGHTGDASGMSMIVKGHCRQWDWLENDKCGRPIMSWSTSHGGMMSEHSTLILGRQT